MDILYKRFDNKGDNNLIKNQSFVILTSTNYKCLKEYSFKQNDVKNLQKVLDNTIKSPLYFTTYIKASYLIINIKAVSILCY